MNETHLCIETSKGFWVKKSTDTQFRWAEGRSYTTRSPCGKSTEMEGKTITVAKLFIHCSRALTDALLASDESGELNIERELAVFGEFVFWIYPLIRSYDSNGNHIFRLKCTSKVERCEPLNRYYIRAPKYDSKIFRAASAVSTISSCIRFKYPVLKLAYNWLNDRHL